MKEKGNVTLNKVELFESRAAAIVNGEFFMKETYESDETWVLYQKCLLVMIALQSFALRLGIRKWKCGVNYSRNI